jgi:hypothetical protein
MKNVLKREYNGFFAIFLSFAMLDAMKSYVHIGFISWNDIKDSFWFIALVVAFVIFMVLRSLKKYTRVLHVEGR